MSREAMIKMMESQLGVKGRPNTATRWYAARNGSYFSTAAWCNMLITWAAYQSGNYQAVCFGTDYAYTVYHAQRFQQAGRWYVDTAGIQRGDIVFFDWDGSNSVGAIDHVGIVTDVNGRDVLTIEGNTSDSCARRVRQANTIVGYGRPAYASTTPTPPPPAGLSAASIRAAAKGGTKLATYSHSSMSTPVDVYSKNGAVYFTGGMTIDCDGRPGSVCNAQTDPYYQAQTAFQESNGQHLDAADLPFAVIPLPSDTWDYREHGIRGGDLVLMAYGDRFVCGVVGDLGPTYRIGEASNAAAVALGINGNPRSGGIGSGVTYVVFPGTKVSPIESKSEAARLGALKGAAWVGSTPTEPEEPPVAVVLTFENAGANGTVWTNTIIQEALNAWNTFGTPLYVDGIFGPKTSARYKQWQESLYGPGPDSDGIPGVSSLTSLGKRAARPFTVIRQGTPPPTPPPTPEPPVTYTPPPLPAGLRPNSTRPSAKPLQAALKKAGYMSESVAPSDNYGPATQAAVRKFYVANASHGWSPDIAIGPLGWAELHREAYGSGTTTPTPPVTPPVTPPPPPTKPLAGRSSTFEQVYPGAPVSESVKVVQDALNREYGAVTIDGDYGPKTTAAYSRWQKSLGYTGSDANGTPGLTSFTKLAEKYGFTVKRSATPPTPPPSGSLPTDVSQYLTAPEPAHSYTRTTWSGKRVNRRTSDMLKIAQSYSGATINVTQGSYNAGGVAASAGTHDGGGVVDISVSGWSTATRTKVVVALRKAGFAAWLRTPAQGFSYHIHAVAIGDREMSPSAKNQQRAYFNGRNGLANNGPDDAERRWPNWCDSYR